MKIFSPFLFILMVSVLFVSCAQPIVRWAGGAKEIKSYQVKYETKHNVFKHYGFYYFGTDVMGQKLNLKSQDSVDIVWGGESYTLHWSEPTTMVVKNKNGFRLEEEMLLSNKDIYYDRKKVSVPYGYRNTLFSYEYEYVPKYSCFSFKMPNNTRMIVYVDDGKLFLQNISYLIGQDETYITHVMVDNNVNGIFGDPEDLLLHTAFNNGKRSEEYEYEEEGFFYDSRDWHSKKELESDFLVNVKCDGQNFVYQYANDSFYRNDNEGELEFTGLRKNVYITINGKWYDFKMNNKTHKIQYGKYKIKITHPHYFDYEDSFTIDENHKSHVINYKPVEAGDIEIEVQIGYQAITHPISYNFDVIVTNDDGYKMTYHNRHRFPVPEGKNVVKIVTCYGTRTFDIQAKAKEYQFFDYDDGIWEK